MSQGAIDERIHRLVALHRGALEQLVDQALDQALAELVAQRIHTRNGNGTAAEPAASTPNGPIPQTKICTGCGRDLPPSAFEKHRNRCKDCRRREHARHLARRRATAAAASAEQEPPRPDA